MWYPDRTKATEKDPPLYLHIAASTPEILQQAIEKVNELISVELGSLVEDKKDRLREKVPPHFYLVFLWFNITYSAVSSANGLKKNSRSGLRLSGISTFVPRLLVPA